MPDISMQPSIDMQKEPEAWFWTKALNEAWFWTKAQHEWTRPHG